MIHSCPGEDAQQDTDSKDGSLDTRGSPQNPHSIQAVQALVTTNRFSTACPERQLMEISKAE